MPVVTEPLPQPLPLPRPLHMVARPSTASDDLYVRQDPYLLTQRTRERHHRTRLRMRRSLPSAFGLAILVSTANMASFSVSASLPQMRPSPFGGPSQNRHQDSEDDTESLTGRSPSDRDRARDHEKGWRTRTARNVTEWGNNDVLPGDPKDKSLPGTGWTPQTYPNPRTDPLRCNTRDIMDNFGLVPNLLLCDPDFALGGTYLAEVASSLLNASSLYGTKGWCQRYGEDRNDWTVGVGNRWEGMSNPQSERDEALAASDGSARRLASDSKDSGLGLVSARSSWRGLNKVDRYLKSLWRWFNPDSTTTSAVLKWDEFVEQDFGSGVPSFANRLGVRGRQPPQIKYNGAGIEGPVEIGVALARKMNLQSILRSDIYYSYEDEDDLINDASQYFSRYLHDTWWVPPEDGSANQASATCESDSSEASVPSAPMSGVLIFISFQDRVCFISTGSAVSKVLPWWRLEHVVANMRPALRQGTFGEAILGAIADVSAMLDAGPPTLEERLDDFIERFGVVVAFAAFTFIFAAWGEYRDRRRRWDYAEKLSKLTKVEKEEARKLQREFCSVSCAICLENFVVVDAQDKLASSNGSRNYGSNCMKRVDSYGIPLNGSDGQPLKMLRCGHVFDETCWRNWVNSGQGSQIYKCPICRQDIGNKKKKKKRKRQGTADGRIHGDISDASEESAFFGVLVDFENDVAPPMAQSHSSYHSIAQIEQQQELHATEAQSLLGTTIWPLTVFGRIDNRWRDADEISTEANTDWNNVGIASETSTLLGQGTEPNVRRERSLFSDDEESV